MARNVVAAEVAIESSINTRAEYNDNIFLVSDAHDAVSSLVITPSIKMLMREKDWETFINSKLSNNNYSDHDIDSNDKYFDITGKYFTERSTFSLNGSYDLNSSLNTESSEFGITSSRVNRELLSIAPQYVLRMTERLLFQLGYTHSDADFSDVVNTGLVAYRSDVASGLFSYNLTELSKLSFNIQAVDYESKDKSIEYQMIVSSIGMNHKLSGSFSIDYRLGASRRDSTSLFTVPLPDFFGTSVSRIQVEDYNNDGLVFDAGFEKKWEASSLAGRVSRDNSTDSFGGLNETTDIQLDFEQKVTALVKYSISTGHQAIESVSAATSFADRKVIHFEPVIYYSLARDWSITASYRYILREFNEINSSGALHSNRVFVGMTYNFPSISTF